MSEPLERVTSGDDRRADPIQVAAEQANPWLSIVIRRSEMSITVSDGQDGGKSRTARRGLGAQPCSSLRRNLRRLGGFIVGIATVVATVITVWAFIR